VIRGVDVSAAQWRDINWVDAAQMGIQFAYCKCLNGNDGVDPSFVRHASAARGAALEAGAYAFVYPLQALAIGDGRSPEEQAKKFVGASLGAFGDRTLALPPAVDLEWPEPNEWAKWKCFPAQIVAWTLRFLYEVERLWMRTPVLYTYPWFWSSLGKDALTSDFARYPLWLAEYSIAGRVPTPADRPALCLKPWDKVTLWQHDGTGGLTLTDGTDVDFDVFLGNDDDWKAFLGLSPQPTAA
jgi:lysozyme